MSTLSIDRTPRPLGKSGLTAFPIAYGFWRFAGTDVINPAQLEVQAQQLREEENGFLDHW